MQGCGDLDTATPARFEIANRAFMVLQEQIAILAREALELRSSVSDFNQ
jgi:hypothetical protein